MFERRGVERLALFDVREELVSTEIYGIPVYHIRDLENFCRENGVTIGVLTVPKEAASEVAETMIRGGVRGIWNFANMELKSEDPSVTVENIHLGDSLMKLCYTVKSGMEAASDE